MNAPSARSSQAVPGRGRGLRWIASLLLLVAPPVCSDAVIRGTVTDILGQRVSGCRITLSHQGQPLDEGVTDAAGAFRLEIAFGDAGTVNLVAEHPEYDPGPMTIRIANFEATDDSYAITLIPRNLSPCVGTEGAIVVGKFLPPAGAAAGDLTGHVHRVLSFRILTGLQIEKLKSHLDPEHRHLAPQVLKCEGAHPRAEAQGKIMARALGAQGLVWGSVAGADQGFDIEASVADVVNIFQPTFTTTSHHVDLDRPSKAVISPMMRVAVFVALMASLEEAEQCQAAIHVSNVVKTLLPADPAETDWQDLVAAESGIRDRCQRSIPEVGLLGDP